MAAGAPIVVGSGRGPDAARSGGGPSHLQARAEQTGGTLTAFENVIAPGDGPLWATAPDGFAQRGRE
jgi:hypothetical protein